MDEQLLRKAVDESVEAAFGRIVTKVQPVEGTTLLRELGGGLAWAVGALVAAGLVAAGLVAYVGQRVGLAEAFEAQGDGR